MAAQAGWYVDPRDTRQYRYWDGERWSQSTQPIPGEEPAAFTDTTANASLSAAGTAEPVGSGAFDQALGSGDGLEPTTDGTIADFMWTSGFGDNDDSGVADSAPDMFATDEAVAAAPVPSIVPAPPAPAPAPSPVESLPVFQPLGATPEPAPAPAPLAPRESSESALPAFSPSTSAPPPPPAPVPTPIDTPATPIGGGFIPTLPSGDQGSDAYAAPDQPMFGATAQVSEFAPAAPAAELSAFPPAPLPAAPIGASPFPPAPEPPAGPKSKVDLFTLPEEAVGVPTTRRSRLKANKKFPEAVAPVMDPSAVPGQPGAMDLGGAAPTKEKKSKRGKGASGPAPRMPSKVAGTPGAAGPAASGPKSRLPMLLGVLAFIVLVAGAYFLFFADSGEEDVATDTTTTSAAAAASPTTTAKAGTATTAKAGVTTTKPGAPTTTVKGATTTAPTAIDEATAAALTKAFTDEATRACDLIKADPGLLTEAVIQYNQQWAGVNKTYEDLQRSVNDCSYAARDEALKRVAAADQAKGG